VRTGPGFTLPGSGKEKDPALALKNEEAMGATVLSPIISLWHEITG